MRIHPLLLLVTLTALAGSHGTESKKQDLLVRSKRRWVLSTIELEEEMKGTYPMAISQMFNNKKQDHHIFIIQGEGVNEKIFSIDEETGIVYAHRPVDRERKDFYHIKFQVFDRETGDAIDKELAFDVEVQDINDNAPQFRNPKITVDVKENTLEEYLPVQLIVFDPDKPNTPNSKFDVTVVSQEPALPEIYVHQVNTMVSQLKVNGCFDYDKVKQYKVIVQAKDFGTPSLSSQAVILINIIDANSHPPKFKKREYHAEGQEKSTADDILRISIEDEDTPNTNASAANYFIIEGNEDGIFEIKRDPKTNEGVLSIIKEKNYDESTLENLMIGVENVEPLFMCNDGKPVDTKSLPQPDSVSIKVKMIDANDPPVFEKEKAPVFRKEEEEPGKVLFTPVVHDVDSKKFRYVMVHDPAKWVAIDSETGIITSIERLDRESPFVESNSYTIIIAAIDDGEPPSTGTSTVQIHLMDINDNSPRLVNNHVIMCGNKDDKVTLSATDADEDPFSGPFFFSLDGDESLNQKWKLGPVFGEETSLITVNTLAYGNYSVPLRIEDQQNHFGRETVHVLVCDCEDKDHCRDKVPPSSSLGSAAIGLLFAGLLLFLLLLLIFKCHFVKKTFEYLEQEEGNQTLIKYNQEGGGAACMAEPTLHLRQTDKGNMTEASKKENAQMTESSKVTTQEVDGYSSAFNMDNFKKQTMRLGQMDSFRSQKGQYSMGSTIRSNNSRIHDSFSRQQSLRLQSHQRIADHIEKRLQTINGNPDICTVDQTSKYEYEGGGSSYQSLDELELGNQREDFHFLDDLGQQFKNLGNICHQSIKENGISN
ncbi:cadherin-like protein 26 isoform X2 [Gouania willdenowi]|uniref:cadherin-like protein 26 isoform X2 n=1 Tax=Gouania willdenowi TaxID=441366 RepID=UPI0010568673|nr:cadherin-like protein 26 isoform X2 [Gouania willdenowi]